MPRKISLTEDEIKEVEKELTSKKATLAKDEAELLEIILNKAKTAHVPKDGGPGWTFTWTYNF